MALICKNGKLEKKRGYDVCRREKIRNGLRYDLTKILPGRQTRGHYHTRNEPELYEVQSGQAEFLMQTRNATKTYLIKAEEKEKIIIPPGFSMRTINPSPDNELILSNWVNNQIKNDYNAFKKVQKPVLLKPKKMPVELKNLEFLISPKRYKKFLTIENCYKKIK